MAELTDVVGRLSGAFVLGVLGGALSVMHSHSGPASSPGLPSAVAQTAGPTAPAVPKRAPARHFTASAARQPDGRVVISGVIDGARPGTRLVVQRWQSGAWTDFPASTATGSGGNYRLWVRTSARDAEFRVHEADGQGASDRFTLPD
jgi:hypothetical protein